MILKYHPNSNLDKLSRILCRRLLRYVHHFIMGLLTIIATVVVVITMLVGFITLQNSQLAYGSTTSPYHIDSQSNDIFLNIECLTATQCYSVGVGGYFGATDNGGIGWTVTQAMPIGSIATDLACVSDLNCYIVGQEYGNQGVIYYTSNGGQTFVQLGIPSGVSIVNSISCYSSTNCIAVGSGSSIGVAMVTSNGTTFSAVGLPANTGVLNSISCPEIGSCIAVGSDSTSSQGLSLATTDAGTSWSVDSVASASGFSSVSCVINTQNCQIGGWSSATGVIYDTGNLGVSDNSEALPGSISSINSISCPSSSDCLAVSSNGEILLTSSFGSTWNLDTANLTDEAGYFGVSCASVTTCYLVGENSLGLFEGAYTGNFGVTWSGFTIDNSTDYLAIDCINSFDCLASGQNSLGGFIAYTTNGGISFSQATLSGNVEEITSISCASSSSPPTENNTTCYAGGSNSSGNGIMLQSVNNFAVFNQVSLPTSIATITSVDCVTVLQCIATDVNANVTTTTNGTSWNSAVTPISNSGILMSISCLSSAECIAVGSTLSPDQAIVLLSNDFGSTWTNSLVTNTAMEFLSVSCTSSGGSPACFVGGLSQTNAVIFASANINSSSGPAWTSQNLPTALTSVNDMSCFSDTECSFADASGNIAVTANGGTTWTIQTGPYLAPSLFAISCITASNCFVAGGGQIIGSVPIITGIDPSVGSIAGGQQVTIEGSGFSGVSQVMFGTASATFSIVNDQTIDAIVPANPVGLVNVTVTNAAGTSDITVNDGYIYTTAEPYTPIVPVRILDTRVGATDPTTYAGDRLSPGEVFNLPVVNANSDGVPSDATSVVLNVTAVNSSAWGYLTAYPTGIATPVTSSVNYMPNETAVANMVQVPIGLNGSISIANFLGNVDVVVDVEGYYGPSTSGQFFPLNPTRIVDTRTNVTGTYQDQGDFLNPGSCITVNVGGVGSVPTTAIAAMVNITATDTTANGGYFQAYPTGQTTTSSVVNFNANESVANRAIVQLGTSGSFQLCSFVSGANAIVDLNGYFGGSTDTNGSLFVPIAPTRIMDTRAADPPIYQLANSTLQPSVSQNFQVNNWNSDQVPTSATAVAGNLTVTNTVSDGGYISLYPDGTAVPTSSDINWTAGLTVANAAVVALPSDYKLDIEAFNSATDAIFDVSGYYVP